MTALEVERPQVSEDWGFTVELLVLADLFADNSYQRPVQDSFVNKIANQFDERLVGTLDVSLRENGLFAVMDGLQRMTAMNIVGKKTCYCSVYTGMKRGDEAQFFYHKNRDRKAMHPFYSFRARVVAGDKDLRAIQKMVEDSGFKIAPNTGESEGLIAAVGALENVYATSSDTRPNCLTPTLRVIREAWYQRRFSTGADSIRGLGVFFKNYDDEEIDWNHLLEKLSEPGQPMQLLGVAKDRTWTGGKSMGLHVARAILEAYNQGAAKRLSRTKLER